MAALELERSNLVGRHKRRRLAGWWQPLLSP